VDESRISSKSWWYRRAGWLCTGLVATTGLCGFAFEMPDLKAETAQRRLDEDDDEAVGRASVNSLAPEELSGPTISPAHHKTTNLKADQQVAPVDGSTEESTSESRFPNLFRWRRSTNLPQDPFTDQAKDKPVSPAQSKPGMRPAPLRAKNVSAIKSQDLKTGSADGTASALRGSKAVPNQNEGPLATRRRLLQQLEKPEQGQDQTESQAATKAETQRIPVINPSSSAKPIGDLEDEVVRARVQRINAAAELWESEQVASKQTRSERTSSELTSSESKHTEWLPDPRSKTLSQTEPEQDLRDLFEQPEKSASVQVAGKNEAPISKAATKAGKKQPSAESESAEPAQPIISRRVRQVADEDATPEAGVESAEHSAELPVQALKLRARKAKEQGRTAAARQLEQAADSIQKLHVASSAEVATIAAEEPETALQHTESAKTEDFKPSVSKHAKPAVTNEAIRTQDQSHPEDHGGLSESATTETITEPSGPSFLPSPAPAFEEPVPELAKEAKPSEQSHSAKAKPRIASIGRAQLQPLKPETFDRAATAVVPLKSSPEFATGARADRKRLHPMDENQLVPAGSSGRHADQAKQPTSGLETARQSTRYKQHEVTGLEPKIRESQVLHFGTRPEVAIADAEAPSLIPTRPYVPEPQALANRSIQLPAPEGWSASRKLPIRSPQSTTRPDWSPPQVQTTAAVENFEAARIIPQEFHRQQSVPRPVELGSIEDAGESRSGPLLTLNGNSDSDEGLHDAHFKSESPITEPALIDTADFERTNSPNLASSWQPSWLLLVGAAGLTMALTLFWTRRRD
jgi:hypothetical protein